MNNPNNVLITKEEVETILNTFGPIGGLVDGHLEYLRINNLEHYQMAFVHESYYQSQQQGNIDENEPIYIDYLAKCSNERMEFLGDHVLKTCLGRYLYERFDTEREGFLTKLKIKIEKCSMLHQFALTLGFKKFLLLSLQIENQTILDIDRGRNTHSYFEDSFESFLGSIIEDFGVMGYIYADRFIRNIIENTIDFAELISHNDNYKDSIQRWHQTNKFKTPSYFTINEEGPLYRKVFTRILYITKDQFNILDQSQKENITRYTEECLVHYQTISVNIYKELFNKVTGNDASYILCLGSGKKVVASEQSAAKKGLENLNLDLNY